MQITQSTCTTLYDSIFIKCPISILRPITLQYKGSCIAEHCAVHGYRLIKDSRSIWKFSEFADNTPGSRDITHKGRIISVPYKGDDACGFTAGLNEIRDAH